MTPSSAPKRRRGEPLVKRIIEATLEEIARVGFDKLSLEQVAARAGVNKTTIWRRWPTAEALALSALAQASDRAQLPDTGSLHGDLIAHLRRTREVCRSPAMLSLLRLKFRSSLDGTLGAMLAERIKEADEDCLVYFERAYARNEIPEKWDARELRDIVLGSGQYLIATRNSELSDHTIERLVDSFLYGVVRSQTA
jgi:AcrR family transcriptional regulator